MGISVLQCQSEVSPSKGSSSVCGTAFTKSATWCTAGVIGQWRVDNGCQWRRRSTQWRAVRSGAQYAWRASPAPALGSSACVFATGTAREHLRLLGVLVAVLPVCGCPPDALNVGPPVCCAGPHGPPVIKAGCWCWCIHASKQPDTHTRGCPATLRPRPLSIRVSNRSASPSPHHYRAPMCHQLQLSLRH